MSHEVITATGQVCYRTKLMEPRAARSFARCIQANASRFQNVRINRSDRSKTEKCFVTFQPCKDTTLDAMHARQQDSRQKRAESQEFMFWQDPDDGHVTWCYSVASQETYQVSVADCSCPDYQYRCKAAGISCKHILARSAWKAARRAEMARRMNEDF